MKESTETIFEGIHVGIDLGTTNSVVTYRKKNIITLQNQEGEDLTPSVVGYFKGDILVGRTAVDHAEYAPKDTIFSIKRLIGRAYSDNEVQRVKEKKYHVYEIVKPSDGTEEDLRVILGGKEYSPIDISSMILKKLKKDAEMRINGKVTHAVITVPAYFTDKQKDATRMAGWKAGLKVQRILDEPSAAAIAYGVEMLSPEEAKTILVYDLGGGTFDVSVLTIAGGVFAQLKIGGDMWLGGDDFDLKIMDYVLQRIKDNYNVDGSKNLRFMIALKKECEKAKKQLSSMNKTMIFLPGKLEDKEGNFIDVDIEITRERFERMIEEEVKKTIDIVHMVINKANLTNDQINNVLLVGGSTMIPMVQRALIDVFGEGKILRNVDPMQCVGKGAGLLATRLDIIECPNCGTENPKNKDICKKKDCGYNLIMDDPKPICVTAKDLGIQTTDDRFKIIIPEGTHYPANMTEEFFTSVSNMRRLKVPIYSGFDEIASKNELMGIIWMILPKGVPAGTPADVAIALDDSGILKKAVVKLKDGSGRIVEVHDMDRGRSEWQNIVDRDLKAAEDGLEKLRKEGEISSETVDETIEKIDEITELMNKGDENRARKEVEEIQKILKKTKGTKAEWKQKAENICNYTDFVLSEYNWLLEADTNYKLRKLVEELKEAIKDDDQGLCEQKRVELDKALNNLNDFVRFFVAAVNAELGVKEKDPIKSDKLRKMRREIEDDLKKGNVDSAVRKMKQMIPIIIEINEDMEKGSITDFGTREELLDYVKRSISK